jgi:alpha-L-fucosidase
MKYKVNKESLNKHRVPEWFHDAKFGIFIHWGLYSVPAFAVSGRSFIESIKEEDHYVNNPYSEWYLNSLRINNSPTQKYHQETYGPNFSYDDFIPIFNNEIQNWNPEEMVEIIKKAGAKYVVLVAKHHDGFLLWASKYTNPKKKNYNSKRDIVGELTEAVKKKGLRMGLYYSGVLDWSFNPNPIKSEADSLLNRIMPSEYVNYANNHWFELIDRYKPIILWNDIGYPWGTNTYEIFAYFYNKFPEGVINNRWIQMSDKVINTLQSLSDNLIRKADESTSKWEERVYKKKKKDRIHVKELFHYDFLTPEYKKFDKIIEKKWETCRGIGNSFGYNKCESEEEYATSEDLIRLLIDIVSKNGNLLLNVGPMADGSIPKIQKQRLLEIGIWLGINGEAIYGTRPWVKAEGKTLNGLDIRYTQKNNILYAILLEKPKGQQIIIKEPEISQILGVNLLGLNEKVSWEYNEQNLIIEVPKSLWDSPAYSFKILLNEKEE